MKKKGISISPIVAWLLGFYLILRAAPAEAGLRERFLEKIREYRAQHQRKSGTYDFSLVHDGLTRTFKVYAPSQYDQNNPIPLVMAFHGGGGDAKGSINFFNLNNLADKEYFMIVYPQGTGKKVAGKVFGVWNAGEDSPPGLAPGVDDVGFISKMLDKLEQEFNVDKKRIYATGFSNGALMCYRLACEFSERIAAIAVGGAQDMIKTCKPQRAIPVLHFHGTEDRCASYRGGTCGGCFADYLRKTGIPADRSRSLWKCRSVPEYINEWRMINGCSDITKVVYQRGAATCRSYFQCADDVEVVLCTLKASGHTWPGGDYGNKACVRNENSYLCREWKKIVGEVNRDFSANDQLWEFFKKHPLK